MATGMIKSFNADKGFGFISRDDGGADVFVSSTEIASGFRELVEGELVEFDLGTGPKGVQATNVRPIGGTTGTTTATTGTTTGTTTTALLRAFNPTSRDHFYTTSVAERDNAVANLGYVAEGVACHVLPAAGAGTTPLLRAFNAANGHHFYTTSVAERDNAVANLGYVAEGVACHVLPAAGANTTPLLRAFNAASGDHFYTTSVAERDNAVANLGYLDEGITCHVYQSQ